MSDHPRSRFFLSVIVIGLALSFLAIPALAQEAQERQERSTSAFRSFDDVTIKRVQPDELPDYRPGLPSSSARRSISDLPQALGSEELRQVSVLLNSTTIEIIAVHTPPRPYRQTEMVYRGHGLWISASEDGSDPVLVTTADWLDGADQVYALTDSARETLNERDLGLGRSAPVPLEDFTASNRSFIEKHASDLVPLDIDEKNPHVNLARFSASDDPRLTAPEKGLVLHDMDVSMPASIFGFSPAVGSSVIPVGYQDSSGIEAEYSFYFLTTFSAILGAPIVGPNGDLLAINALRYPTEPDKSLAIPPGAIHSFLNTGRADVEIDPDVN